MPQFAIWAYPTRIVFGVGAASETGSEAKRIGATKALIVTDKGVVAAGLLSPIEEALRKAGVVAATFAGMAMDAIQKGEHKALAP